MVVTIACTIFDNSLSYILGYVVQAERHTSKQKGTGYPSVFLFYKHNLRKEYEQIPLGRGAERWNVNQIKRKDKSYETVDHIQQSRRLLEPHL